MSEKITITEKEKLYAIEVIVDSEYYNDNEIYRKCLSTKN